MKPNKKLYFKNPKFLKIPEISEIPEKYKNSISFSIDMNILL